MTPVTGSAAASFTIDAALLNDPKRLSDLIEVLIARVDVLCGDADFEPNLGSTGAGDLDVSQIVWAQGVTDEREEACEDEGAQCDDEGSDTDTEPEDHGFVDEEAFVMDQTQVDPLNFFLGRVRPSETNRAA